MGHHCSQHFEGSEFKASLVYRVSTRKSMVTQRYHFIKTKQDKKRIDTELTYILEVMLELNLHCSVMVRYKEVYEKLE